MIEWITQNWIEIIKLVAPFIAGGGVATTWFVINSTKYQNRGTQILGNQTVNIHHYGAIGIGDPNDLKNNSQIETSPSKFYPEGLKQLEITQESVKNIGDLLLLLTTFKVSQLNGKALPQKGVCNDHHRHLEGAIFAFGSESENYEWKEHGASSIREGLTFWEKGKDFSQIVNEYCIKIKININEEDKDRLKNLCQKITLYYRYFTGITHHQPNAIVSGFRLLEDSQIEFEECQTSENYKRVFKKFFIDLNNIVNIIRNESN